MFLVTKHTMANKDYYGLLLLLNAGNKAVLTAY